MLHSGVGSGVVLLESVPELDLDSDMENGAAAPLCHLRRLYAWQQTTVITLAVPWPEGLSQNGHGPASVYVRRVAAPEEIP